MREGLLEESDREQYEISEVACNEAALLPGSEQELLIVAFATLPEFVRADDVNVH